MGLILPTRAMGLSDFVRLIRKNASNTCTCDIHQPQLYRTCTSNHAVIKFPHEYFTRQRPELVIQPAAVYEALHLARSAIQYFSRAEVDMSNMQRSALDRFRNTSFDPLGAVDGAAAVSSADMMGILTLYNQMFFFGVLDLSFAWKNLGDRGFAHCISGRYIEMDPLQVHWATTAADRQRLRLAVLLHECLHAFLGQLACKACGTNAENQGNAHGHGRAFQVMVLALGDATQRLFGVRLYTSGFRAFQANWSGVEYLPSEHDLEQWRWEDAGSYY